MKNAICKNKSFFIFSFIYIIFTTIVSLILKDLLYFVLGWNIFLATLPLLFSTIFIIKYKDNKKTGLIVLFLLWLLFFPNAPYLMTDFIHLQNEVFYQAARYEPTLYFRDIKAYLGMLDIVIGCWLGLMMTTKSLYHIHTFLLKRFKKIVGNIMLVLILILSGFGIYIGRFLRFNSWDILKPFSLMKNIIQSLDFFSFKFTILFAFIILFIYMIYYYNIPLEEKKWVNDSFSEDLKELDTKNNC